MSRAELSECSHRICNILRPFLASRNDNIIISQELQKQVQDNILRVKSDLKRSISALIAFASAFALNVTTTHDNALGQGGSSKIWANRKASAISTGIALTHCVTLAITIVIITITRWPRPHTLPIAVKTDKTKRQTIVVCSRFRLRFALMLPIRLAQPTRSAHACHVRVPAGDIKPHVLYVHPRAQKTKSRTSRQREYLFHRVPLTWRRAGVGTHPGHSFWPPARV